MHKIKPFLALFLLPVSLAFCQSSGKKFVAIAKSTNYEDLRKPNVIKISPLHLFDNQFQLTGEFFKKSDYKSSFVVSGNFIYADNDRVSDQGFALDLQRRIYPRSFSSDSTPFYRNSAGGFYLGLGMQLGYNEYRDKSISRIVNKQGYPYDYFSEKLNVHTQNKWAQPYVVLGYQVIVWDALYIDFFVGGGLKMNFVSKSAPDASLNMDDYYTDPDIASRYYKGIIPKAGITMGVGF